MRKRIDAVNPISDTLMIDAVNPISDTLMMDGVNPALDTVGVPKRKRSLTY